MLFIFYLYELYALNSSETMTEFSGHNMGRLSTNVLCHGFRWPLLTCKLSVHRSGYKIDSFPLLGSFFSSCKYCSALLLQGLSDSCLAVRVSHCSDFPHEIGIAALHVS